MLGLALAYLRDRSLTTALNVLLLALAVATLVILLVFSNQIGKRFERDAAGVELVVGAKGSPLQLILSSLYQIDAPTGNVPLETVDMLRSSPSVAMAVPLALGDNFRGFRIVGTEPDYVDLYGARLSRGQMFAAPGEAVIGSEVARRTGMDLGQRFVGSHGLLGDGGSEHAHNPFMAVGVLEPTGSVIDRLIIVSVESVWDAHGIAHEEEAGHNGEHGAGREQGDEHETHHDDEHGDQEEANDVHSSVPELQPEVTAVLVKYRNAFGAVRLPAMINRNTNMQAAVPAIETARLLSLLGSGIEGARLFAWLLALTGGLSIFVALLQAASAREGELALLRVMGASRLQVFGTILAEGLLIAAAGCVIGVIAGHGVLAAAVAGFDELRDIGIDAFAFDPGEVAIVLAVLALGVLAAFVPAIRVFRKDLAETLARAR